MLRSYFYNEGIITSPTLEYASASGRIDKLKSFQWFDENNQECLRKAKKELSLKKRVTYGLPLDVNEFSTLSTSLLL